MAPQIPEHRRKVMDAEYAFCHQQVKDKYARERASARAGSAQAYGRREGEQPPYKHDSCVVVQMIKNLDRMEKAEHDKLREHKADEIKVCLSRECARRIALTGSRCEGGEEAEGQGEEELPWLGSLLAVS